MWNLGESTPARAPSAKELQRLTEDVCSMAALPHVENWRQRSCPSVKAEELQSIVGAQLEEGIVLTADEERNANPAKPVLPAVEPVALPLEFESLCGDWTHAERVCLRNMIDGKQGVPLPAACPPAAASPSSSTSTGNDPLVKSLFTLYSQFASAINTREPGGLRDTLGIGHFGPFSPPFHLESLPEGPGLFFGSDRAWDR